MEGEGPSEQMRFESGVELRERVDAPDVSWQKKKSKILGRSAPRGAEVGREVNGGRGRWQMRQEKVVW